MSQRMEDDLRELVKGDVLFDEYSRRLYSTDASIYEVMPIGVVLPRSEQDVIAVIRYAYERGVPILPRGGGSSLSGQAIGEAIILDFTKFMDSVLAVNTEERWVRVQPGVIYEKLNQGLRDQRLKFGPDPASGNRASVGGLIGNNSTGAHSILYGMTADNVESLRVVLSNGDVATLSRTGIDSGEFTTLAGQSDFAGQVVRGAVDLCREHESAIRERYPRMRRNVAGYNLRDVLSDGQVDLIRLLCGSEGTLATVVEAKLRLVPLPKATGMVVLCFEDLVEALRPVSRLLALGPSSVEVVDRMLLDLARTSKEHGATARSLPERVRAALFVEFYGETEDAIRPKLAEARRIAVDEMGLAFQAMEALDTKQQSALWSLRKAGLPIFMSRPGDAKPTAFVEDTAVSPDVLPDYIAEFLSVVERRGTAAAVYAHAGGGCLHIRPIINLKASDGVEQMRGIADEITDLVVRYGGTTSSEHGDGMVRTQWLRKLYGDEIVAAFGKVKALFDPRGIMNPGKIVNPNADLRERLRFQTGRATPEVPTTIRFDSQIDFARAVEMCNGCGGCRDITTGVMCPTYRAWKDEILSTRGRGNLTRHAMWGKVGEDGLRSRHLKDAVLDPCLGCKACKRECPSGFDFARIKTELKHQFMREHGRSLADILFGHIDRVNRIGSALAPVVNFVKDRRVARVAMEWALGLDRRRALPRFHRETFVRWFTRRTPLVIREPRGNVAFFYDCYMNHNRPEIGMRAVELLEGLGFGVVLADRVCCGRAMLSRGLIEDARRRAAYNVPHLARQIRDGYAIVGCEPSCVAMIQDDYTDLVDLPDLDLVRENTYDLTEFLVRMRRDGKVDGMWRPASEPFIYHGHCHQKAIGRANCTVEALKWLPGAEVNVLDSTCCGMAGSFGYEKRHYELSMAVGELLFTQIRGRRGTVVASGMSCRSQIEMGLGIRVAHPAEVLANALEV